MDIIEKCDVIYRPAGQAGEYSPLATNPYRGCGTGCKYCYVPAATFQKRIEFDAGAVPRKDFLKRLTADAARLGNAARSGLWAEEQIMLSFTTDPYHPGDTSLTRDTLIALRDNDLSFCTLTKGGMRALRDIDLFRPDRDAFASTLTHLDPHISRDWEPNAAQPWDRLAALRAFHDAGIFTWASLEPVFDTAMTLRIIQETSPFVDLYKIGRINYSKLTRLINWRSFAEQALELFAELGKAHYVKKDLQPFLPMGYSNPLRVQQHH